MNHPLITSLLLLAGFGLSTFLAAKLVTWAPRLGLIDVPNHRSSHQSPKPRGGGLSFFVAYMVIVALFPLALEFRFNWVLPILVGGGLITLVGLVDDLKGVSAGLRLFIQLLVAALTMVILSDYGRTDVSLSFLPGAPSILVYGFCFLFMMWMINLYNFMDGVDGMAATQAVVVATLSAGLCYWQGNWPLFHLYALIAAVTFGFLWFNWSPAKIFMGDSGAYFLGFLFACLALMSKIYSRESFFSHVILLGVFISDATFTLLMRAWRRQKLHQGHRTHAFQHIVRKGWTHAQVTCLFNGITVFWLGPMAVLATISTYRASLIAVIAYLPLLALMVFLRAGREARVVLSEGSVVEAGPTEHIQPHQAPAQSRPSEQLS